MADFSRAKYVQLQERNGQYILTLLDGDKQVVANGYKGPTLRRAQQDLRYWTKDKGLEELPSEG